MPGTLASTGRLMDRIVALRKECIRSLGVPLLHRAYTLLDENAEEDVLEVFLNTLLAIYFLLCFKPIVFCADYTFIYRGQEDCEVTLQLSSETAIFYLSRVEASHCPYYCLTHSSEY